jgi:hypothetical protein
MQRGEHDFPNVLVEGLWALDALLVPVDLGLVFGNKDPL